VLSGYRGFGRELARTGSWRALWLQLRTGAAHVARRALGRAARDPVAEFLASYAADGFRLPDADAAALQLAAEACLVCGLCDAACARVGGRPPLGPREAVIAAARLAVDWVRLELTPATAADPAREAVAEPPGSATAPPCAGCRACEAVCPVAIPISRVQTWLSARPMGPLPIPTVLASRPRIS
jgi:Fe-S oxidoreductase